MVNHATKELEAEHAVNGTDLPPIVVPQVMRHW